MSDLRAFLNRLKDLNIKLALGEGGKLRINAPKGAMNAELRDELKARKQQVIEFFSQADTYSDPSKALKPIPLAPRDGELPLSFSQQRLWFLDQLEGASTTYNIPTSLRFEGLLDVTALTSAADESVRRHEVLRTHFPESEGRPRQVIEPPGSAGLKVIDLSSLAGSERLARDLVDADQARTFDLARGPLQRITVVRIDQQQHLLLLNIHHIISDGWSSGIQTSELVALYNTAIRDQPSPLPELPIQYADYAYWQRQHLSGENLERQLSYWKTHLSGAPELLALPTDRPRPAQQTFAGSRIPISIDRTIMRKLEALAADHGATLFMVLLAAYVDLLSRYSGSLDVSVGTPTAGRNKVELEGLIGFFVNTLVLRLQLTSQDGRQLTLAELIARVRAASLGAWDHADVPFEKLVNELNPQRDMSHAPLFQVFFVLQNAPKGTFDETLKVSGIESEINIAKFDMTVSLTETHLGLLGALEYNSDLFDRSTAHRMETHLCNLINAYADCAGSDTSPGLCELSMLEASERQQLLIGWNDTDRPLPQATYLHQFFAQHLHEAGDKTTVLFGERHITHGELEDRVRTLGRQLVDLGVGADNTVAVFMERGPELYTCFLAITRIGGVYVPVNPNHPPERQRFMLTDIACPVVLTQTSHLDKLHVSDGVSVMNLDDGFPVVRSAPLPAPVSQHQLAYIIYTSGSTGKPKGVMVTHTGLVNMAHDLATRFSIDRTSRLTQIASPDFDASVLEMVLGLCMGATLCSGDKQALMPGPDLAAFCQTRKITTMLGTPAALAATPPEAFASVTTLAVGGEACTPELVATYAVDRPMVNAYGPTEATIVSSSSQPLVSGDTVDMGLPISNTRIYVLNPRLQPVPVGVSGELFIAGPTLARGYLSRPDLTAAVFIPDPFSSRRGERLYRSGDLVCRLANGHLLYNGRIDFQVKIRGFRIELGEIRNALESSPAVAQATVLVTGDSGAQKRLLAFVIPGEKTTPGDLKTFLAQSLPEYMIPSAFVFLDQFPLTINGKIDNKALLQYEVPATAAYTAPRTQAEEILCAIWTDVLKLNKPIGTEDNFFELGGHSLSATQVISRIRVSFETEVPLQRLFETPTIGGLAAALSESSASNLPPLVPQERTGPVPLSFSQQRLWFLDRLQEASTAYNMPASFRLQGPLNLRYLESTFDRIIQRHESLRTHFRRHEDNAIQVIADHQPLALPTLDLSGLCADRREQVLNQLVARTAQRVFRLTEPLLSLQLIRLQPQEHALLTNQHHIITDGWSIGVMVHELSTFYNTAVRSDSSPPDPIPDLPFQYADYALWQRSWLQGEELDNQVGWWREQLADSPEVLNLPTDAPRPALQTFCGSYQGFSLDKQVCSNLENLGRTNNATLFMVLLAVYGDFLARYSGQNELTVGTPVSGRNQAELEGMIGFFVNTLVLPLNLSPGDGDSPTVAELIGRVRGTALGAWAHGEVPFEKLVSELNPERDMSHSPLFQAMFVLQNTPMDGADLFGLRVSSLRTDAQIAKFDLTLTMAETEAGLQGSLEYNTDLFTPATATRMVSHLVTLIQAYAACFGNPNQRTSQLSMLDQASRHRLLHGFNDTRVDFPREKCLHEMLQTQYIDRIALVYEEHYVTFTALECQAQGLAKRLVEMGAGPEKLVGIAMDRSLEMLISVLAILKAGAAYVPLDLNHPTSRLQFLLTDSQPHVLITHTGERGLAALHPGLNHKSILDLEPGKPIAASATHVGPDRVGPENGAYVIYTSGSTGQPKGVLVPHRGIVNHTTWLGRALPLVDGDKVLLNTSLGFDASCFDIYAPLSAGMPLVLARPGGQQDPAYLVEMLITHGITRFHGVPALLQMMMEVSRFGECKRLRSVNLGGEDLSVGLQQRLFQLLPVTLVNHYGLTEVSVDSTFWVSTPEFSGSQIPIGSPVHNTAAFVLDAYLQPVPVGVPGELHLTGVGLARGYLNKPALTAERFIPCCFDAFGSGSRLYRTGDLTYRQEDGNLVYLGRIDHQVKLRGSRIELSEISCALEESPAVTQALVLLTGDTNETKKLVAYFIPAADSGDAASAEELSTYLSDRLPAHMVPAAFVGIKRFPLTPNGKLDKKALPEVDEIDSQIAFKAPQGPMEEMLCGIWSDILRLNEVSVNANFFHLGGNSLLMAQAQSRLVQTLQRNVAMIDLFRYPTVAQLASHLGKPSNGSLAEGDSLVALQPNRDPGRTNWPMSFAQSRLWFLDQLEGQNPVYNMPVALRFRGHLNPLALEQAIDRIQERHQTLRTRFTRIDGQAVQVIDPFAARPMRIIDLTQAFAGQVRRLASYHAAALFNLATGPLYRIDLIRLSEQEHVLLTSMHHIISDGWSMGVLVEELMDHYRAAARQTSASRAPLPIQYTDYTVWQRTRLDGAAMEQQINWWREQLDGASELLTLPTDRPRPPQQTFVGSHIPLHLDVSTMNGLNQLASDQHATLFMVLLAIYTDFLARYGGREDVTVGTPNAGRSRVELEGLIGFFINTLAMRVKTTSIEVPLTVAELIARVRTSALGAFDHAEVPFEKLVSELNPQRDMSHAPIFQVLFVLQNAPKRSFELEMLEVTPVDAEINIAKFDLTLSLTETEQGLFGSLEYNTDLFDSSTATRMLGHLSHLIQAYARVGQRAETTPTAQLALLPEQERNQLLHTWNDTSTVYPYDRAIHQLIEEQAARAGANPALVGEDGVLTYRELDRQANQLANHLRDLGVGREQIVAVLLDRNLETIVVLCAVLKAGGAYLPIDPGYPQARIRYLIQDSGCSLLVTDKAHRPEGTLPNLLLLDENSSAIAARAATPPPRKGCDSARLAYVIYTSGSTGKPKGVGVPHASVIRLMSTTQDWFSFGSKDVWTCFHSFAFDFSIWEIWGALTTGGSLVLVSFETSRASDLFAELLEKHGVTVLNQTPSAFFQLLPVVLDKKMPASALPRVIVFGGEALDFRRLAPWYAHFGQTGPLLVNMYGITETCVHVTYQAIEANEAPKRAGLIGEPIPDLEMYLLDADMQPVPFGVAGEIHVGGAGPARGYLNRPGLTAERFVPCPYSGRPGGRLYKSGDLACRYPDGNMGFAGRKDHQVKIRGFRIETGEIEAALVESPQVTQAVVVVKGKTDSGKHLVAYVVTPTGAGDLRAYLSKRLPDYMVPAVFVPLETLPLTASGKTDLRALPEPDELQGEQYIAPANDIEELLASIWTEVLERDRVGRNADFFALGGHSLLATQAVSRIRDVFGVEMPLRDLFEAPVLSDLADRIVDQRKQQVGQPVQAIVSADRSNPLPLSFAQERLWFLDQLEGPTGTYNMPSALRARGRIDVASLEQAMLALGERHEILRTRFALVDGAPIQVIVAQLQVSILLVDLSALEEEVAANQLQALADTDASKPFDLVAGPLFRVTLIKLSHEEHGFLVNTHHIVSDGWSQALFVKELIGNYYAFSRGQLPQTRPLVFQYADYAAWQRSWFQGPVLESQLSYWTNRLEGITTLDIPTDRPRPALLTFEGGHLSASLAPELCSALETLARKQGASMFMVLLAAFKLQLARITGQMDVTVGTPIAGRIRAELEDMLGCFLNNLVLRTDLSGEPSFSELLLRVRETCLGAYDHQDTSFEKLLQEIKPDRDRSRTPLFQVFFNMLNLPEKHITLPDLELAPIEGSDIGAKFDITLYLAQEDGQIHLNLSYNKSLFSSQRMVSFIDQYQHLLTLISAEGDACILDYDLITQAARSRLPDPSESLDGTWFGSVPEWFGRAAASYPERPAVISRERKWSYAEMHGLVNQLAGQLVKGGIRRGDRVAVYAARSGAAAIAVTAALAAGGVFVMLDPAYPDARLIEFLEICQPKLWIGLELAGEERSQLKEWKRQHFSGLHILLAEDGSSKNINGAQLAETGPVVLPEIERDDPAYVAFTSGSTGKPKGILGRHGSLTHFLPWMCDTFNLDETDRYSMLSGIGHDPLQRDIFTPLCLGAALCVPGIEDISPNSLPRWMKRFGITVTHLTPAMGQIVVETQEELELRELKLALFVGDRLLGRLVYSLRRLAKAVTVVNMYGSTETQRAVGYHVAAQPKQLTPENQLAELESVLPLGRGMKDVQLLVLNTRGKLCGIDELGEIYIRSPHVALGYLGESRASAFSVNPFTGGDGDFVYRTGDLGRNRADGNVVFVSRADFQLKIRGFRIEPAEIEAALLDHEEVIKAVVLPRTSAKTPNAPVELAAYVQVPPSRVTEADQELRDEAEALRQQADHADLRLELHRFLMDRLPNYMVPASIVLLAEMPITPNRKIDRAALSALKASRLRPGTKFVPPRNNVELRLVRIWEDLLETSPIGVQDNWFELGGHSMLAIQLMAFLKNEFNKDFFLASLFQGPTIEQLALLIQDEKEIKGDGSCLVPIQRKGKRIPFFCIHPGGGTVLCYNDLAKNLGRRQPFYGLQSRVLFGALPSISIHEMAEDYLAEIREVQASGPYRLGGWSLGGLIAFEIACLLREQGEEVDLLAIIDSYPLSLTKHKEITNTAELFFGLMVEMSATFGQDLGISKEDLEKLDVNESIDLILHRAKTADMLPPEVGAEQLRRLWQVFWANHRANHRYVPENYPGRVVLLRAMEKLAGKDLDLTQAWGERAEEGIEVLWTPGNHMDMINGANAKKLAKLLSHYLGRSPEKTYKPHPKAGKNVPDWALLPEED